ncbi:hypothetical protein EV586_102223 [Tumebacillus sp. BK434]|uniref:hypothetical protein n=1 Tax=Tumebacillus sp. BK434 TaxID=2512169 RepID=UPI00104F268C|nr:hypothetical protein [Tumebacillus sp. BK434]TCP57779.1 hypothetical protein EV586_102223 [Tumebacillus sp. BK434]
MTAPQEEDWKTVTEQRYQKEFDELRSYLQSIYSYDSSRIQLQFTVLEESRRWYWTASKFKISLIEGEQCHLALEMESLEELEKNQPFIDFLGTVDGNFIPIGSVYLLKRLELAAGTDQTEIAALVHAGAVIVVCAKEEMTRQVSGVQEKWHEIYGFRSEKEIEFEGTCYYRYDSVFSWHY